MDGRRQTRSMVAKAKWKPLGNIRNVVQTVTDRVLRSKKKPKKVEVEPEEDSSDLLQYLFEKEKKQFVREERGVVTKENRSRLVDYLMQLRHELSLQQETLELAVGLVDRSLALVTNVRQDLQYLGVAAMLVACKYEEPYFCADDLLLTTDMDPKQVFDWENRLLHEVNFSIALVRPSQFFVPEKHSDQVNKMTAYFCNIGLYSGLCLLPSQLVAVALTLSCELCDCPLAQKDDSLIDLAYAVLDVEMKKCKKKLAMTKEYEESGGHMTDEKMSQLEEISLRTQ